MGHTIFGQNFNILLIGLNTVNNKRLIAEIINGEEVIMTIDDNMLSCEFGSLDRGNITDVVDWGIYANRGSISFIDNIGYFNNQNINSTETKKYKVNFYLAKTSRSKIAVFNIENLTFDEETREVNIELIGAIIDLQRKTPNSNISFSFAEKNALYLLGLSDDISEAEAADYGWYYPSFGLKRGEDSEDLERVIIYCPFLDEKNAWDRISNICQSTMYRVVEDENGDPVITGSFPNRKAILVRPNNILYISGSNFVKIKNTYIDVTNRNKYTNKKVEQISKHFDIQFNEDGDPIGISNCDYNISNNSANISCFFDTPYKIYSCSMPHVMETVERTVPQHVLDSDGIEKVIYVKASYVSEALGSSSANVAGTDKKELLYQHEITSIVKEYSDGTIDRVKSIDVDFYLDYFEDNGTTEEKNIIDETNDSIVKISSNDLIQSGSYYEADSGNIPLSTHILNEVSRRYSNGIECFEIECLFNDYYYDDGSLAFSSSDLSTHFKKYDVIIPYVMKNGKTVPLSKNQDGTPKKFRVIGISYSYDGLLKQKLSVQEERYDVD